MDFSDSVCASLLRALAGSPSPLMADPFNASIPETQFRIVRDQRIAMAAKLYAKFRVANVGVEEIVKFDQNSAVQKFVTFDPNNFEADELFSSHAYFMSSIQLQSAANLIQCTIQEDLTIAHAENVCRLSKQFHLREGRDLENCCCPSAISNSEEEHESSYKCAIDTIEDRKKFLMFDFDALECGDTVCLGADRSCAIINDWFNDNTDETLCEAEFILNMQFKIIGNFQQAESSTLQVVACKCEAETVNSVHKFICVPNLESFVPTTLSTFTYAEMFGVCTSLTTTICADSVHAHWPHQPILVVANNGIQNYPSLVETFTPSKNVNDEFDNFSELALEAFPFEPFDDITVRLLKRNACTSLHFKLHICAALCHKFRRTCVKQFQQIWRNLGGQSYNQMPRKAQKNIVNNPTGDGQKVWLRTQNI
jgi:hypothetical protein